MAAFTAANKIEQVVTQMYVALGATMATYSAQNMGAGKVKRIHQGFMSATVISFVYAAVTGVLVYVWGYKLTGLFVSENLDALMPLVDLYLRCVAVFFIPLAVVNVYRNGIQGMGFGFTAMLGGVAELVGRGVVAIVAAHYDSYLGICMASPMAWILAGILFIVMYCLIMKEVRRRHPSHE